jgi:hypothetical protein
MWRFPLLSLSNEGGDEMRARLVGVSRHVTQATRRSSTTRRPVRGKIATIAALILLVAVFTPTLAGAVNTWSSPTNLDATGNIQVVNCADPSFCTAGDFNQVENSVGIFSYNGATWSSSSLTMLPSAISCPTSTFCAAVDRQGAASIWDGTSWSTPIDIDANSLTGVSCPSSSFCLAADNEGNVVPYQPGDSSTGWLTPFSGFQIGAQQVACVSMSLCWLVFPGGAVQRSDVVYPVGNPLGVSSPHNLNSISCVPSSFCVAVDAAGNVYTQSGTASWSTAKNITAAPLTAVSCASTSFCVAGDNAGNIYTYNGTLWSGATNIDGANQFNMASLSCPTTSFCAIGDRAGNVLTYEIDQGLAFNSTPPSNPQVGGTYAVSATGGSSGNPVTLSIDAKSTSGCSISGSSVSFYSPAGSCVIDANQSSSPGYFAAPQIEQSLTVGCSSLTIGSPSPLPPTTHDSPYSTTVAACGGQPPYTFTKAGKLPKGLKMNKHGVISGTPKKTGNYSFGVVVRDKASPSDITSKIFSLVVS